MENQAMYSPSLSGGTADSQSSSRTFVYEVKGLRQNGETDKTGYPIRQSGSVFIAVPYNRMNQEMRRIARMGGKIVSIQPLIALPKTNMAKVAPENGYRFRN